MIFSEIQRTNDAPRLARETSFAFLNRSSRPEIARVRALLTDSIAHYPANEIDELVLRIRSGDQQAFRSATFELLLHEALHTLGFVLQVHPELENGATTRPDFLVQDSSKATFYLEAVLASSRDGTNKAAEALKSTTLEALSLAPHQCFRVDVDCEGDPTTQPRSRDLIRRTHDWLDSLDADALLRSIADRGFDSMPVLRWAHEAWTVTLRPLPISLERRGTSRALIGMQGGEGRLIDDWSPLRNAIKKKGNKYGDLDRPLVVAVNAESFNLDRIDEMQALFGQEEYVEYPGRPELGGRRRRIPNGAWAGQGGAQFRRVSGAWFFNDLSPYSVATRRNTLYLHPLAYHQVPESMLRFPHTQVIDGHLRHSGGVEFGDIFGLPRQWPE